MSTFDKANGLMVSESEPFSEKIETATGVAYVKEYSRTNNLILTIEQLTE